MADLLGDDPAAEFLQQEEDQLRELGIDENQFGDGGAPPADNGGDIMGQFEDLGGAPMDGGAPQEPVMNGFTDPAPAPVIPIQPVEEPESLKKWREEKAASLQKQVHHFYFSFEFFQLVCKQLVKRHDAV